MLSDGEDPRRRVIALDSCECFAIESNLIDAKVFRSKTALAYELEQYLPLDAEQMVIDVISAPKGGKTKREDGLILIADRKALDSKISDLEKEGTWIAGISSQFLMGAQLWCQEQRIRDGHILWQDRDRNALDYLRLQAGIPTIWRWLDLKSAIEQIVKDTSIKDVHIVGSLEGDPKTQLESAGHSVRIHEDSNIDEWAAKAERMWVAGVSNPWSDLRRNIKTRYRNAPMYPSLLVLTTSLLLLLSACSGYVYWRNSQLSDSIATSDQERTATFERLFPKQSVPTDIPGRLVSELRKLESSKQELSKEPPVYSMFPLIVHFLNQLPTNATFRIDAIRAKSQMLNSVEGSAKSLTDFQTFVSSLRTGGFQFAEPSVTQMKDGFSLRLERLTYRLKDSDNTKSPSKVASQP
jgi:hypothetical protein